MADTIKEENGFFVLYAAGVPMAKSRKREVIERLAAPTVGKSDE